MNIKEIYEGADKRLLWVLLAVVILAIWFIISFIKWIAIAIVAYVIYIFLVKPLIFYFREKISDWIRTRKKK